ncbi:hypothetical protein [Psychromicrobium sp. YIM B11713]|uniref:hypothetical protein n=1 Tax=Psychromicrobium sp. YIM B11713 TaxID=3145233 RepID=UPI00374F5646
MPLGMKLELTFDPDHLTLGELRAFLLKAESAGATDSQPVSIDLDENETVSGLSLIVA